MERQAASAHECEAAAAVLLIAVPIAFNAAFFELGRTFEYPNILRHEPDEILRRFAAGGSGLLLRWQALLVSALAVLPLVALPAVVLRERAARSPVSGRRSRTGKEGHRRVHPSRSNEIREVTSVRS